MSRDGLSPDNTKTGRYQRACWRIYQQHAQQEDGLPTNGLFIFYEGLQAEDWPKHYEGKRQPHQDVADALLHLREIGRIPWEHIRDETRTLYEWSYASTVTDYLIDCALPIARIQRLGERAPAARALRVPFAWGRAPGAAVPIPYASSGHQRSDGGVSPH